MRVTTDQAADAVALIMHLGDEATKDGGRAAELHLGPEVVKRIVEIRDTINEGQLPVEAMERK